MQSEREDPERIWYEDPRGFLSERNYWVIVPTTRQSYAEQMNAAVRFSFYYAAIMVLVSRNVDMLVLPLLVCVATFFLYRGFREEHADAVSREAWREESCVRPTQQNPFMNYLNGDPTDRAAACDPLDLAVKADMDDKFESNIFRDVDDVWGRDTAGRTFHTTPSTTVPNQQTELAEWLYSGVRAGGKHTRPPRNSPF